MRLLMEKRVSITVNLESRTLEDAGDSLKYLSELIWEERKKIVRTVNDEGEFIKNGNDTFSEVRISISKTEGTNRIY